MILDVPCIMVFISMIKVEELFDEENLHIVIGIIIITAFVFGRVLNKNRSKAMRALRGYCTYKEALRLLENEEFERIEIVGEKLMVSKKWIYVFGTFVPKNLVVGFYKKEMKIKFDG